jgi:hypothetical protein
MATFVMQSMGCDVAALNTVHFSEAPYFLFAKSRTKPPGSVVYMKIIYPVFTAPLLSFCAFIILIHFPLPLFLIRNRVSPGIYCCAFCIMKFILTALRLSNKATMPAIDNSKERGPLRKISVIYMRAYVKATSLTLMSYFPGMLPALQLLKQSVR